MRANLKEIVRLAMRSMRKRFGTLPAEAEPASKPPPARAFLLSGASDFDVSLSRRYFDTQVWRRASWFGFPIVQLPTDLMALQEVLYEVRPRVVIECGTNRGGGAVFFASILQLLHGDRGRVISIDITAEPHLREQLDHTRFGPTVTLLHGSSTAPEIFQQVRALIRETAPVLVFLDSDHSYAHVRDELNLYHALVSPGSYLIVFDTICRFLADMRHGDPSWAEDNPLRAVEEFVAAHPEFTVERRWEKYMATFAPYGFLRRA